MDAESGPIRCDSTLSVIKIQAVNERRKGKRLLTRHKFGDPEIEELYQLHSANQKKTELFRCFLYSILFYSLVHIIVYAAWIRRNPTILGGDSHDYDRYDNHKVPTTTAGFDEETPETMTLNTYASMLETSHSKLQKSVFHVDETSDILQYSVVKDHEQTNQYPTRKKVMSLETGSRFASVAVTVMEGTPPPRLRNRPSPHIENAKNEQNLKAASGTSTHPTLSSSTYASFNDKTNTNNHLSATVPPESGSNTEYNGHVKEENKQKYIHTKHNKSLTNGIEDNNDDGKTASSSEQSKHAMVLPQPPHSPPSNQLVDWNEEKNKPGKKSRTKSFTWFPYSTRTNYFYRSKRNIVTRGTHRYTSNKNKSRRNEYELESTSGLPSTAATTIATIISSSSAWSVNGESKESIKSVSNMYNPIDFKAYAYSQDDSEFDTHSEPSPQNVYFICTLGCLLVACVFIVTFMLLPFKRCPRNHHIPVIIWSATILCSVACTVESSIHPRLALGWILLETFLIWITLPLRMRTALFYTSTLALLYVIVTSIRERNRPYLGRQIGADIILIVITNIMGMLEFYLSDKKQRRAFIDTRQSLEMKLVIEEQAKEQERLLLSVLPEHLALKMRQDLGEAVDGQFKKIYMSRHENVSILYADIVGFTAISSTYSASELVKILNELFATFDKLAEKYNQIRIKILGDCYYCICGAPEERADHAILCVHMGLSMVKAIKYVREKTKSSVDMRVGIHTGAILAGVLGQRQWQFDIYSKDVVLANKMESSGKPGRVHVSDVTLGFLNDGFEVEPAYGEKREEILRTSGIKTYFIVRPIKPFRESGAGMTENGDVPPDDTIITKDLPSDLHSTFAEDSNSAIEESHVHGKQTELEAYRLRLKEELLSRDGYKDLSSQSNWLTLSFRDSSKESEFTKHKDPYAGIYYGACPIALVAVALSAFSVVSFTVVGLVVLLVGLLFLGLITTFSACETSPMKSRLKKMSGIIESICSLESELWVRRLVSVLGALILSAANVAFMIPCLETKECSDTITDEVEEPLVLPNLSSNMPGQHVDCRLPAFFIPFAAVILFGVTLLTYLGFWLKSLIIITILFLHSLLMFVTPLKAMMECSERLVDNDEFRLIPVYYYLALFAGVAFAGLFSLNRRLEKSARVLFLWKTEVEHQRETATQLRQKNEALVYNILPPHVATHFLGSRRRKHEELYSLSYSEVGILFASMPNFSDFYTEETVNNQGLECLRFLNEVISDYDALLELPKFNEHIIKIKTIASTYMAASGLSPSKQAKSEDPVKTRWHHLSLLVEFAFELKRALTSINEQSFNHFVLKMGINHGPITAGVIGARKPHYDIWGNSVNVASRMESTGKAGCIQVTAETHRILRLYGYQFEQRGLVNVKGKGQLMTYYLIGRGPEPSEEEVQKMLSEPETDGNTVTQ